MKINLSFFLILILVFSSCQKREWTNPFDPDCPKTVFTPSDFRAVQVGNTIKLSWVQSEKNISGFKLTRKIDPGTTTELPDQTKVAAQYIDGSVIGGKVHTYTIIAYAGAYQSNVLTTQITPILTANVTTSEISVFDYNAANLGGNITADGGSPITQRGVCYSTSQNPTTSNSFISNGNGTGSFSNIVTGFLPNTIYYLRAYAINSQGTSYGQQVSFKTAVAPAAPGTVTDSDANTYNTITIGTQIWMAENLKTTKFNDGKPIPNVTSNTSWIAQTNPVYCWYNNDISAYKNKYGALYNWYAVNTGKLAPTGFHVATPYEWSILANYLGGTNVAGAKIKLKFGWDQNLGTNTSGFSLLPAGFRASDNGSFQHEGYAYNYWLISEDLSANSVLTAYILMDWVGMGIPTPTPVDAGVKNGKSVRCLKDAAPSLTTNIISSISLSTAACGGVINCSGGQPITSRGVCWSTSPNPTITNSKTTDGAGLGTFSSNLTGLVQGTTYYVRAYATNSIGTAYGNEVSFKTNPALSLASLTTSTPSNMTSTSATLGGNVSSDGNATVTERGVCYSTSTNPTTSNSKLAIGAGTGSFSNPIAGLIPNTTYYVKAYAINSQGTAYGNEVSFKTSPALSLASLTTSTPSNMTSTSAILGGIVSSDGNATVTERGICYSTSQSPTTSNSKVPNGSGPGSFSGTITGLTANTTYYVRAYAINSQGTAYGNVESFIPFFVIGDVYKGGIIAYIFQSTDPGYVVGQNHGLIAAPSDQGQAQWYNGTYKTIGTSTGLGEGLNNTYAILNQQGTGSYAARICNDLVLGGYSDWYLPSREELNKLYINSGNVGGFSNSDYWSSSQSQSLYGAFIQNFGSGTQTSSDKKNTLLIRAIRLF
ncbi:MAG: DUF1566 domain-containing protein [Prolixibacteraceae bacterium]|nr:DUF1566 domain-containing protein [Prolixibacteraceae bacterium]